MADQPRRDDTGAKPAPAMPAGPAAGETANTPPPGGLWPDAKKLALATFSMPAAVGILDKYEQNLGLSALLKKIVRHYDAITAAIWGRIGELIPLPPDFDVNFYSFFALILAPVAFEFLRRRVAGRRMTLSRPGFWGIASTIAFAGYCMAFSTQGIVAATIAVSLVNLFAAAVFALALLIGWLVFRHHARQPGPVARALAWLRAPGRRWPGLVLAGVGIAAAIIAFLWWSDLLTAATTGLIHRTFGFVPEQGSLKAGFLFGTLILLFIILFGNLRAPAYAFFWAFGVFFIDYLATDLVPALNQAIDAAT